MDIQQNRIGYIDDFIQIQDDQGRRDAQYECRNEIGDDDRSEITVRPLRIIFMDLDGDKPAGHRIQRDCDDLRIADEVIRQANKAIRFTADILDDKRRQQETDS